MSTAPDRMYYTNGCDCGEDENGLLLRLMGETRVHPHDIEYLRATPEREAAGEMRERVESLEWRLFQQCAERSSCGSIYTLLRGQGAFDVARSLVERGVLTLRSSSKHMNTYILAAAQGEGGNG